MAEALKVLIAEDRPSDAELIVRELKRAGFEPDWRRVDTEADFARGLTPDLDVVLSDYSMPQFGAPQALEILKQRGFDIPFIIVSGTIGEETAVAAMKQGASDYLLKDRLFRLGTSVRQAVEQRRERLERRRMSEALAAADRKYRELFDSAPNGIFQTTSDGRILTANKAAAHICGFDSPEEMIATVTNLQEQLYVDADRRREFQRQALELGVVSNFEAEFRRKDGDRIWVSVTARAVRDEAGAPRYDGILVDISDRKRAEADLIEAAQRYRRTLDAMMEGCQIIGHDWRYLYVNDAAARHGRQSREALISRRMGDVYPGIEATPVFAEMERCQLERTSTHFENEFEYADGSSAWFELSLQPVPEGLFILSIDITERKLAAEALRASQSQLLSLVEQAPADLAMFDRRMVCLAASRRWVRDYGRGRDQVVGVSHYDLHPDIPEHWKDVHRKALAGEAQACEEELWLQADGSEHWLRWAVHPWRDAGGEIGGVMILADNITPRKQADRAVVEWKNRYEAAVNASGQMLYDWNAKTDTVTFGGNCQGLVGYTVEEMAGGLRHWVELIHPHDVAAFQEKVGRTAESHEPFAHEYRVRHKSGSYVFVEDNGHSFADAAGELARVMGFVADISKRKRAEQRAATQHAVTRVLASAASMDAAGSEILRAICETTGTQFGAIWEVDRHENLLRCAKVWRAPGFEAEELEAETRGSSFASGVGLPGRAWAGGTPLVLPDVTQDRDFRRPGSAHRCGLLGAFAFPIASRGEVTGVIDCLGTEKLDAEPEFSDLLSAVGSQIGQFIDHRRAEQQLLQAQKMEAVGQLAGGIAHDFNNLLGVMIGYIDLAARELGETHRTTRRLDAIRKAANRAAALTRQILTFSRKQPVEARLLDLNDIVAEMETMLRRLIGEDVRLAVVLGEALGRVRADPGQLEQVVMNLAVNARDAMPVGGRLVIETSLQELDAAYVRSHPDARVGPHVTLQISDSGEGMSRETVARIFEPFFTTKPPGKGTGLGLAVVYGIVRQSGGSLSVYSELGHGTTFKIYLPQVEGTEPVRPASGVGGSATGGSETILLLEDEEPLRTLFAEMLRMAGYSVLEAADPRAASVVAAQGQRPIQLLITDVVLPGQSGPETARQLRVSHPDMRVLLVSGYTDRMLEGNPDIDPQAPFLSKPFTGDDLLRKVRAVLDQP